MPPKIDALLVPQGAEFQACQRGWWSSAGRDRPPLIAIPAGPQPVQAFLAQTPTLNPQQTVVLLGLGGALQPGWAVGRIALYRDCWVGSQHYTLSGELLTWLQTILGAETVTGLGSDRLITQAQEKQALGKTYQAALVDMESGPVLRYFQRAAVLRIVSDDCTQDLPDLTAAFDPQGRLRPLPLVWSLAREPRKAAPLIRGSLRALSVLTRVAARLGQALGAGP